MQWEIQRDKGNNANILKNQNENAIKTKLEWECKNETKLRTMKDYN